MTKKDREEELKVQVKRLEAKYSALQVVPIISKIGQDQQGDIAAEGNEWMNTYCISTRAMPTSIGYLPRSFLKPQGQTVKACDGLFYDFKISLSGWNPIESCWKVFINVRNEWACIIEMIFY